MDIFIESFLMLYVLISCAGVMAVIFHKLCQKKLTNYSARAAIRVQYFLLLIPLICLLAAPLISSSKINSIKFEPFKKQFVSPIFGEKGVFKVPDILKGTERTSLLDRENITSDLSPELVFQILFFSLLFLSILIFLEKLMISYRFSKKGEKLHKLGRVEIRVYQGIQSPFAVSFIGRSIVGIPQFILSRPKSLKIVLKHELLHLKYKDTLVSMGLELLKSIMIYNPLLNLWVGKIEELQEMRIDECLAQKGKQTVKLYGNTLIEVISRQQGSLSRLIGATGMGMGTDKNQLSRRMVKMTKDYDQFKTRYVLAILASAISLMLTMAVTAKAFSSKKPITVKGIKELIQNRKLNPEFILVTPEVIDALNMYTKTKKGRSFTEMALKNYAKHKKKLHDIIQIMDMPQILVAVAFVESGFSNVPENRNPVKAAGMWQFIPSTAKTYNMAVDKDYDDRMDISIETIAAMQYLKKLHRQFTDWHLAILAYNMGEKNLEKGIDKVGSRDPYQLVRNGIQGDTNYLARVHAAMLILQFPEIFAKGI